MYWCDFNLFNIILFSYFHIFFLLLILTHVCGIFSCMTYTFQILGPKILFITCLFMRTRLKEANFHKPINILPSININSIRQQNALVNHMFIIRICVCIFIRIISFRNRMVQLVCDHHDLNFSNLDIENDLF